MGRSLRNDPVFQKIREARHQDEAYRLSTPQPHPTSTAALIRIHRTLCNSVAPTHRWPRSITAVTGLLANKWTSGAETTRAAVARAWKIGKLPTEQKF
ncbi:hypothetical protein, partial [Paraburkholderia sp. RL18-085-BIA-A]